MMRLNLFAYPRQRILCLALILPLVACDASIQKEEETHNWLVGNGIAYDQATLDLKGISTLVIPDTATLQRQSVSNIAMLYMEKRLSFGGHPVVFIDIDKQRHKLGCAQRRDGDTLTLATVGEWDTGIEGGASLTLLIVVPENISVVRRTELSGNHSLAQQPKDAYWAAPNLTPNWHRIPDHPDAERHADYKGQSTPL